MSQDSTGANYSFFDAECDGAFSLPCTFTKISQQGHPALLARIQIYLDMTVDLHASGRQVLTTLLQHVEELNMRLPMLRVSVRIDEINGYMLILQGLKKGKIGRGDTAQFLKRVTQDFCLFLSYAKMHDMSLSECSYESVAE